MTDVEKLELGHFGDKLENRASDLCPAHVQIFQIPPMLQMGDADVRHIFRVTQVENFDVFQRRQLFEAEIGNLGVSQIDVLQVWKGRQLPQIHIGDPGIA